MIMSNFKFKTEEFNIWGTSDKTIEAWVEKQTKNAKRVINVETNITPDGKTLRVSVAYEE